MNHYTLIADGNKIELDMTDNQLAEFRESVKSGGCMEIQMYYKTVYLDFSRIGLIEISPPI